MQLSWSRLSDDICCRSACQHRQHYVSDSLSHRPERDRFSGERRVKLGAETVAGSEWNHAAPGTAS
jgi:hypothetical protein